MPEATIVDNSLDRAIFEQLDDEPLDWYDRFMEYYVALGRARTLRAAYLIHNEILAEDAVHAPSYDKWRKYAREFNWKKRAEMHDYEMNIQAQRQVEQARVILMEESANAARALGKSLKNSRTRVPGAKAILDRVGLPPMKEITHKIEGYTADELAQAAEEIVAWEKQMEEPESSG